MLELNIQHHQAMQEIQQKKRVKHIIKQNSLVKLSG